MSLDDDLSFKGWQRVWIYFVMCRVLTLITFATSLCWDHVLRGLGTGGQIPMPQAPKTGADDVRSATHKDLEPSIAPEPTLEELFQQVRNKLRLVASEGTSEDLVGDSGTGRSDG